MVTIRAIITTYQRPSLCTAVVNRLSPQFSKTIVLDNSKSSTLWTSLAPITSSTNSIKYFKTGEDIGFDRNLAEGIRKLHQTEKDDVQCLDLLCGDDDQYASNIGDILNSLVKYLLAVDGKLPPAIILGHTNYASLIFQTKQILKLAVGKNLNLSPSGSSFLATLGLSNMGSCVFNLKQGSLWKIERQDSLCNLLLNEGLPRYIGIAYSAQYLNSFLSSPLAQFFFDTMHLYAAPLIQPLFNAALPPIYYFLPNKFAPIMRYYVGDKDWTNHKVYVALTRFYDALIETTENTSSPLMSKTMFLAPYSWLT
jgi:hypothetical protein